MDEDQKLRWQVIGLPTGASSSLAEFIKRTEKKLRDRENAEQSPDASGPAEMVDQPPDPERSELQAPDRARASRTSGPSFSRHKRLCQVCRHPARESIEHDFLDWRNPIDIAIDYKVSDRASVVRHARAAGLVELRRHNVRAALERLIECAEDAAVNGHSIVSAVRTYLRITDDGKLVEPPTRVHLSVERSARPEPSGRVPSLPARRPPRLLKAHSRSIGTKRLSRRLSKPRKRDRK